MGGYTKSGSSQGAVWPSIWRLPTQYPAVAATMREPVPVAWVSRMRPPAPVSAPGKGATAQGKLWVSAVKSTSRSRVVGSTGDGCPGLEGIRGCTVCPRMALPQERHQEEREEGGESVRRELPARDVGRHHCTREM